MRKALWQKSSSGPDWTDVETLIRAVDQGHGGKTGVLISAVGRGASGGLEVMIVTTFDALPGSEQISGVESRSEWPCKDCATLETHIFRGLYQHDYRISEAYRQEILPGA